MHDLRGYESASSSWPEKRVFTSRTIVSSRSMAETVPSKWSTLSISSSTIFCCLWTKSSDLLVWWFCCCWDVGGVGVPLMLVVVLAFLVLLFVWLFVCYTSFTHNKDFITNSVIICEIFLYLILSFVFAPNQLVKKWNRKNRCVNISLQCVVWSVKLVTS